MAQENNLKPIVQESDNLMADFTPNEYTQTIWNRLTQVFTEQATAGLMGNLYAESGCTPYACQPSRPKNICLIYIDKVDNGDITEVQFVNGGCSASGGYTSTQLGFGLAQWTETSRKQAFYDNMKPNGSIGDLNNQLNFLIDEMQRKFPSIYSMMQTSTSIYDVSDIILENYENPSDQPEAVHIYRRRLSSQVFDTYAGGGSGQYRIYVETIGNGNAYVSPATVNYGETYELICTPASGEELLDINATEIDTGYSVAIPVQTGTQTILMQSSSDIQIIVTFSGDTPTPPTPVKIKRRRHMPIWMYPMFRKG